MYLCHSSFLYFSSDPEDLQVSEIFDACKAFMKYCAFKSYPKVLLGQVTWRYNWVTFILLTVGPLNLFHICLCKHVYNNTNSKISA